MANPLLTAVLNAAGAQIQQEGGAITPATMAQILQLSQFGSSGALLNGEGDLLAQISSAGLSPANTGSDYVIAAFSIPANGFDQAGRILEFYAQGTFANNGHNKDCKIIFNPATAVVGSVVGNGGTTLIDTGTFSTAALTVFSLNAMVVKYGAANSNTQMGLPLGAITGSTHGGFGGGSPAVSLITATENAPILVAVTGNAGTTAADILLNFFQVSALN